MADQPDTDVKVVAITAEVFDGKTVVISCKIATMERKDAELLVEGACRNVMGSVSGRTCLMVAGEKPTATLKKPRI